MRFRWHDDRAVVLERGAEGEAIVAALLARRGYSDPEAVAAFLQPTPASLAEPLLLRDLGRAIERLTLAHGRGESIAVWGDYDVDGLTSTALLCRALGGMGFRVQPHIPHRITSGYGLKEPGIDRLTDAGVTLIVAVDCGVSDREAVAYAGTRDVDVLIFDHHTLPPLLPDAAAVVNPRHPECAYPYKEMAAVGVAYALVRALVAAGFRIDGPWQEDEADLLDLLELVALGTVADVAPLHGENRTLVSWGLDSLRHTAHPGLQALCAVAGIEPGRLTAWEIGHTLGPRLNAAGRIADPAVAIELLLCDSPERALPLAQELDRLNRERQRELTRILGEATDRIEADGPLDETRPILQIEGVGWTAGVVGLVAGRLAERYGRPAIVLERGEAFSKGSARSIDGFNLVEALHDCADLLSHYGGHARAAGLTVANERLDELRERLLLRAKTQLRPTDLQPTLAPDLDIALGDLHYGTVEALARLEPFGHGNPEPLLIVRDVTTKWAKTSFDGKHLFFHAMAQHGANVPGPLRCVAFGQGTRRGELQRAARGRADLVGTLRREWWQGEERLAFHIKDFRTRDE
ncbi:MAG: single-stranded-DNA-specific exonuclease RecJ [Thermomicrobiales bacterium]